MFYLENYKEGLAFSLILFVLVLSLTLLKKPRSPKKALLHASFAAYLGFLFALVSLPIYYLKEPLSWAEASRHIVWQPVKPLIQSFKIGLSYRALDEFGPLSLFFYNTLGNLLLLMPLALFNRLIFKVSSNLNLLICLLASLAIETWQVILNKMTGIHYRIADINDVILNTVGAACFILVIALFDRFFPYKGRSASSLKGKKILKKAALIDQSNLDQGSKLYCKVFS